MPCREPQGYGRREVGLLSGCEPRHDAFMYELYLQNSSQPLNGYTQELQETFGLVISVRLTSRWFSTVGPFKGSLRVTLAFPSGRNSWSTYRLLYQYLYFIESIEDHTKLIFADEKPIKEIMIFRNARMDVRSGITPKHTMNENSKNRYSIIAAFTVKGNSIRPVECIVLEQCTDAALFV